MHANNARTHAIMAITNYKPEASVLNYAEKKPTEIFGINVFNDKVMRERLPKTIYKSIRKTIEKSETLDVNVADTVAIAMKEWAIEKGATHYTHVFYPLTGLTAEKHDSFLMPDGNGGVLTEFSGAMLTQGEADGSSFPSGGLRSTFEARGYTAWDLTSPAYLMEQAGGIFLCIPTAFFSWTGLALDKKTPLLRSNQALSKHAARVLKLFDIESKLPIIAYAGLEQEYFLIDRHFFFNRPDLLIAGRTLFGAKPPKGQEFEDQYFGVIPRRVLSYMMEVEHELYKLGVPVRTRHNEAAPSQYELAPVYEEANLASDHNQMMMTVLKAVAKKYGMVCLLHEKPFAGINGSGKHLNYSIGNAELGTLFDPGETPQENAKFLVFLVAAIRGLHKYGGFLRASVASASNDHRLGAHEAPPAIMSIFLGDQLTDVLEQFRIGQVGKAKKKRSMNIGVDTLPPLSSDAGDRNRTSPFAFNGNRFEFRAVGSSMSSAEAQVAVNALMAESLDFCATFIERQLQSKTLSEAVQLLIQTIVEEHSAVIFNGDGYSNIWHSEAERRGLANYKTTPEALEVLTSPEVIDLCINYKIFTKAELKARQEIYLEQYSKTILTEAKLAVHMARTIVYPAAIRYQNELASAYKNVVDLGFSSDKTTLDILVSSVNELVKAIAKLEASLEENIKTNALTYAKHSCNKILPAMQELRIIVDKLELTVAEDLWNLPSYQEMLFIK